jgi:hypothetical protein
MRPAVVPVLYHRFARFSSANRENMQKTIRPAGANAGMPARRGFSAADSAAFFTEKFEFAGNL